MRYIPSVILLLAASCSSTVNTPTCDMTSKSHVCPERGHGPCPFCPSKESIHRYEVRIINSATDELLHTTDIFNDAYDYVVEYSSAHSDLVIFDLVTGERYEETP